MSEGEPLSRPPPQGGAVFRPVLISLIYRRFIVDHCRYFHANTELTGLKAAGLSRIPQPPG